MPESFKFRLFIAFGVVICISSSIVVHGIISTNRLEQLRAIGDALMTIGIQTAELLEEDKDFINTNHLDPDFYRTGHSAYLQQRESRLSDMSHSIDSLFILLQRQDVPIAVDKLRQSLHDYNTAFSLLCQKQLIRGFKDYGLEGKMRSYAHQLERSATCCSPADILMLRRHEKDFFLRLESEYIDKLNALSGQLIAACERNDSHAGESEVILLRNYLDVFNEIAQLEMEIGRNGHFGMKEKLRLHKEDIKAQLNLTFADVARYIGQQKSDTTQMNIALIITGLSACLLLAFFLSRSISRPIEHITKTMRHFNTYEARTIDLSMFRNYHLSREVRILVSAYNVMTAHIRSQFDKIETQKQKLENQNRELTDLNHELDKFAYSVSHDLRSPLTSIMGLLNLAKMEHPNDYDKMYLRHIDECVARLDGFIKNLLIYTRNKNLEINNEPVCIRELVEELSKTYLIHFQSDLDLKVLEGERPFFADRHRLTTVLQNLLSNSIRYRHPGRSSIEIRITRNDFPDHTEIRFSDNGIGIAPEAQSKVFDMFYRDKNSEHGTGLGLFIVKRIIQRLQGDISLLSKPGDGTIFTIRLPKAQAQQLPEALVPGKTQDVYTAA